MGDKIFSDQNLVTTITSPDQTNNLIVASDYSETLILEIDQSGNILSIDSETCGDDVQSSSTIIRYATNSLAFCADDFQINEIWYEGTETKTLETLVNEGIPVFISKYYSELYTITGSTSNDGAISSGVYGANDSSSNYYKRSSLNTWGANEDGNLQWSCPIEIPNDVHELSGLRRVGADNPSVNEFCNGNDYPVSIFYVRPEGLGPYDDLISLAKMNTPIYKTRQGAEGEDSVDLFESNIFADPNKGYLIWENKGDNVNLKWLGYDDNNSYVTGSAINVYGHCEDYVKPLITENELVKPNPSVNDVNVFYGFYSCDPEVEGKLNENDSETVYWPIYVIDGLHTTALGDEGSHIKDFIDTLSFGNVIQTGDTGSCLEYAFKIVAEDLDDAILLLNSDDAMSVPLNKQQRTIPLTSIELGLSSEALINIYENENSSACIIGDSSRILTTYSFPILDEYDSFKFGPNFNTQTNYKLDNVAKPLLRTNPKLSGNVKIVTDSNGLIYLESINADAKLADIKYKKYPVNSNGNYASDVSRFFRLNGTPSDLIYLTKRSDSDLTVLDSYDKQIEEEYQYGTVFNYSKNYDESYKMFAPIWADNNMPRNFVIFKVKDPSSTTDVSGSMIDILKNAEIIKSFDLSKKSNLGKYIRNHIQQETFPKSPISVSFNKNETTNYNGIDLKSGEITSKGEFIYKDFVEADKPLIESNDFITDGFRRNDILCANLLNLEFLFDDDNATDYSVNRYFGLYVDDIDSGTGEINSISNTNIVKFGKIDSLVDSKKPSSGIPSHKQMSSSPTLGYIKINDIFYKISNSGLYDSEKLEVKIDDTSGEIEKAIGISHIGRSVDITNNAERGYDFVKMTITDIPESNDRIVAIDSREESYKFTFIKHVPGESINIHVEDSTGDSQFSFGTGVDFEETAANIRNIWGNSTLSTYLNINIDEKDMSFVITETYTNLGDLNMSISGATGSIIRIDQLQTNVNIQNRSYLAKYTLPKGTYSNKFFSNQGTLGDIASALASAIDNDDSSLEAYNIGADIWIKVKTPGYRLLQHAVLVSKSNVVDFIKVENHDINNLLKLRGGENTILSNWVPYYLNGGNSSNMSVFVDNSTISEISVGDYLETRYDNVYNKVLDIVEDITEPNSNKSKIILELKSDLKDGETRVFNQNIVKVGLFSAYDIYDMNFDFYDTSNSDIKELNLETRENIQYEPYEHAINNIDPITGEFSTNLSANDIFNDDFALEPINYFSNLSGILNEESIGENLSEIINSEFDRLKENQLKQFSINSRVVPNINKWVLKDSLTVRDQPYYLNVNEAFGRTNFSPDLSATGRNKNDMTHEWFYMEKKPKYLKYNELNETFSYVNFIEGFELTPDLFKSTKHNYFDKFMITDGFEKNLNEEDLDDISNEFGEYSYGDLNPNDENNTFFKTELKKKYTLVDGGGSNSFANTIFKGLNVVFKNRKEFVNDTALDFVKSSEFNGYKFSILLKTNTDVNSNDVEFEVIQNKKFNFVIFFITLNISDYWIKDNVNRKLLYELNHKIVYDRNKEDYIYANTLFDGALNWNSADTSGDSPYRISGIEHFDGSMPDFDNQILLGENGLYGNVVMDIYPNSPGNTMYKFSIYSIEGSDTILVEDLPVNVNDPNDKLDIAYLPNYIQKRIKYYYEDGGTNIHKSVLEKISINNVADMVNLNNNDVKYTTIEEDGTSNDNRFTINFKDGNEIIKQAKLSIEEDNDKPKSYKLFKGTIGYDLVESNEALYYPFLVRHSGSYTVDFKPVITFTDMYTHFKSNRIQATGDIREIGFESKLYKHSMTSSDELTIAKSYYERYNRCGTTFNVGFIKDNNKHDGNWGIIKNHFYHKVNEINPTGVTKLSESSDKLPLYPLIDEIAISKKDVNVFKSSWDPGYYTRSFSGGDSIEVPGTLETKEEKSYLGSTVMKIKEEYDITSFNYANVDTQEELDHILRNSINWVEVLLFEDDEQIVADFYVSDATVRLLRNQGVLSKIQNYVSNENSTGDKTTLVDDADFYINKNIIEKFVVDSISLYTRRFKGGPSIISDVEDASLIASGGYSPDNNFTFKSHKQKPMNFRLIYNKRLGYSYDIKPMIKIKS